MMSRTARTGSQPSHPPKLLTLQQASAEYGPPYTSLRDQVLRGVLPAIRLGARIWVRRADLDRFIDTSRVTP